MIVVHRAADIADLACTSDLVVRQVRQWCWWADRSELPDNDPPVCRRNQQHRRAVHTQRAQLGQYTTALQWELYFDIPLQVFVSFHTTLHSRSISANSNLSPAAVKRGSHVQQRIALAKKIRWKTYRSWLSYSYYKLAKMLSVSVPMCPDVNQGGTNRSRCTQIFENKSCTDLLLNPGHTPKLRQSDLRYWLKSPAEESGWEYRHFQASWASQPMGCLMFQYCIDAEWQKLRRWEFRFILL